MPASKLLAVVLLMASLAAGGCDGCGSSSRAAPDAQGDGSPDSARSDVSATDGDARDAGPGDVASTDTPADVASDLAPADAPAADVAADMAPADVAPTDVAPTDVGAAETGAPDVGPTCITADGGTDGGDDAGTDGGCLANLVVFSTGVDGTGVPLAGGSVDPHYTLIQSAEATLPGPNAIVVSQIAEGYWVPQSSTSKWIAPSANQMYPGADPCNASGTYVYRTTFDLTGYVATTAKIVGSWAADNMGVAIRLNGTSLGLTAPNYTPLTPFTIDSGFAAGRNTLDFEINDLGCPNGLRVDLSGTAVIGP